MTAQWIRNHYKVPAKQGGRIRYTNLQGKTQEGTITGFKNQYLKIRLDGNPNTSVFHPTWNIEYL